MIKRRNGRISKTILATTRNCFFIGRSVDFYVGLEGALKLKEISYIQAEGFAGGRANLFLHRNVVARGANPCIISMKGLEMEGASLQTLAPLVAVIPLQLISYYAECDVDKPRNLAKSVTVE